MSKEKFELLFLAGGTLLDALSHRLRRGPATARERVGAAMHELRELVEERREEFADPGAIDESVELVRAELCADTPRRLMLLSYLEQLHERVTPFDDLADAVTDLRAAVTEWLA